MPSFIEKARNVGGRQSQDSDISKQKKQLDPIKQTTEGSESYDNEDIFRIAD
jgi:hypothetical protein